MPYNTAVPTTGHVPAADYVAMQQNYAQIQTSFSIDHIPLANGTNEGYHKKVDFSGNNTITAPSDPASGIFTANGTGTLFSGKPLPMFVNSVGSYPFLPDVVTVSGNQGFQFGPLKISMGTVTISGGAGSGAATLAYTYSTVYTAVASINKNAQFGTARNVYTSVSGNILSVIIEPSNAAGNLPVYYLVIGT